MNNPGTNECYGDEDEIEFNCQERKTIKDEYESDEDE
tara:strand:+ start:730 stop:840 length:111 start_codon:yes stop_codon:yes gene_type:complete